MEDVAFAEWRPLPEHEEPKDGWDIVRKEGSEQTRNDTQQIGEEGNGCGVVDLCQYRPWKKRTFAFNVPSAMTNAMTPKAIKMANHNIHPGPVLMYWCLDLEKTR